MYSEQDLNRAVEKGIFSEKAVTEFRTMVMALKQSPSTDEENFRLLSSFNDIFVVITSLLLLVSSSWVFAFITDSELVVAVAGALLSWGLAEFFVKKRRMALPAIILLGYFVWACFHLGQNLPLVAANMANLVGSITAAIGAYLHWRRFRVAVTVAVAVAAIIGIVVSGALINTLQDGVYTAQSFVWLMPLLFGAGLLVFGLAMYWDSADRERLTEKSDVAFWLHLLASGLIIHPVFSSLGAFDLVVAVGSVIVVVALYLAMTVISLVIDRRAFMLSSLAYVVYAVASLLSNSGQVSYALAVTGVLMGGSLLLLSAFWHQARALLLKLVPAKIKDYVPAAQTV